MYTLFCFWSLPNTILLWNIKLWAALARVSKRLHVSLLVHNCVNFQLINSCRIHAHVACVSHVTQQLNYRQQSQNDGKCSCCGCLLTVFTGSLQEKRTKLMYCLYRLFTWAVIVAASLGICICEYISSNKFCDAAMWSY